MASSNSTSADLVKQRVRVRIYGLEDPCSGEIRYVGKTQQRLSMRLADHLMDAERSGSVSKKRQWLRQLIAFGLKPRIFQLEIVDYEDANDAERFWAVMLQFYGCPLTNDMNYIGAGGTCPRKVEWTPETLALLGKISDTRLGKLFGVTTGAIQYYRKLMDIPASFDRSDAKPPPNMGGWNKLEIPQHIVDRIGNEPDYVLGNELGVAKTVIARLRRLLGIPPYAETTGNTGKFKDADGIKDYWRRYKAGELKPRKKYKKREPKEQGEEHKQRVREGIAAFWAKVRAGELPAPRNANREKRLAREQQPADTPPPPLPPTPDPAL